MSIAITILGSLAIIIGLARWAIADGFDRIERDYHDDHKEQDHYYD